jgi:hypothetical protein
MRSLYAYAFSTALAPADVFRKLRETATWMWVDRESDRWGDYVSSVGVPGAIVKVFCGEPSPDRCAANVRFESEADDAAVQDAAVRKTLLQKILPSIGATDVTEIEYLE